MYVLAAGTFAVLVAGLSFYRLHRSRERKKRLSQTDDNEQQDSLFMEDRILYTYISNNVAIKSLTLNIFY